MPLIHSPEYDRALVAIASLTGSPRSSTGSTSVLEWNSNSGSEGFSVRSLEYAQSSPPTPDIPTFSPNLSSSKTSLSDHDQTFVSFNSAAPVTDSVTTTLTGDTSVDEYHNLLSALEERLTLQDSVTQWQDQSYRKTAGLDRPDTPSDIELLDGAIHDKPATSPKRSCTTDSSSSALTAKPAHVSSLFFPTAGLTPPTPPTLSTPQLYSVSPSVVSNQSQLEGISIAQYFQLKAAKEAEPVQPQVDGLLRPISAASCLSYTSSARSSVASPLPDPPVEAPLLHQTQIWHDWISKADKTSSSTTAYPQPTRPPRSSSIHPFWYQPTYPSALSSPTRNGLPDLDSSPSAKSPMENNNIGSQFSQPVTIVTHPPTQAADTLESNLKSHAPSKSAWPIPPAISSQFEPVAHKSITPNPCLTNIHNCPPTHTYGPLHGNTPGKSVNCPVPAPSQAGSPEVFDWRPDFSCTSPWKARFRDIRQTSPESTDSVLPPPPSTPSVSSLTRPGSRSGSPMSASGAPPGSPLVNLQQPYLRHATPSHVPYESLTPTPASPVNGAYTSQRTPRALPIPSISRPSGSYGPTPYMSRYTGSTLPRDMHWGATPATPWGPTPRRLRFAPLPPTPSAAVPFPYASAPGCTQPTPSYTTPLPLYPSYPVSYPYHTPAPAPVTQLPAPISAPYYPSWRSGPTNNPCAPWTPHPVFWYSDGSIVFRVCHSFFRR